MNATDPTSFRLARRGRRPVRRALVGAVAALSAVLLVAGCSSSKSSGTSSTGGASGSGSASNGKTLHLAYLSFAVQNSYDAPMLAAAKKAAAGSNAKITVFDANNSAQTQFSQFQDAIASGKYDGILVQAVDGSALLPLVAQATSKSIKVVALDQVLGPDLTTSKLQVPTLSASVVFVPSDEGFKRGTLAVQACESLKVSSCQVGYLFDIKASSHDTAVRSGFDKALAGHSNVKVVAEGESKFSANGGLTATQTMLQGNSGLNVIVGSDQGVQGAASAVASANKKGKVLLVGDGGSAAGFAAVKAGTQFGDVPTLPATEGRLAVGAMVKVLRVGQGGGAIDPVADLPDNGIVTAANVDKFTAEWAG